MECWSSIGVSWIIRPRKTGGTHLDTSNSELDEGSEHLSSCDLICGTTDGALDQEGVVVGLQISTYPSTDKGRHTVI